MMMPDAGPRLILVTALLLLTTEVLPTSGRDLEDGLFSSAALLGSDEELNDRPQIYGLYLESAKENSGGSKFRDMAAAEKRARLFVGKRLPSTAVDGVDDYFVVSSSSFDGGSPFVGGGVGGGEELFKRNHLFVGKRGSPRFVGKRNVIGLLTRAKRYAENEEDAAAAEDDDAWKKTWMGGGGEWEEGEEEDEKRSRLFVGKRRESELNAKRARLFVGRRSGPPRQLLPWREAAAVDVFSSVEGGGGEEEEKRSRLFVGKRPSYDHHRGPNLSSSAAGGGGGSEGGGVVAEKGDGLMQQSPDASSVTDLEKRPRLFPGKRPAPGFVGKRPAPGFVGKRDA